MVGSSDFEKENAFMLSGFEAILGKIDSLNAQIRSQKNIIVGLEYEKEQLGNETKNLKRSNQFLKEEIRELNQKLENQNRIIPQNFLIRNKIVKIVSDIEDKEITHQNLKEIIGLLIEEIDDCISQLEE
jgi:predicted RNase H-like nuclease (RuvC/YqgF family)